MGYDNFDVFSGKVYRLIQRRFGHVVAHKVKQSVVRLVLCAVEVQA